MLFYEKIEKLESDTKTPESNHPFFKRKTTLNEINNTFSTDFLDSVKKIEMQFADQPQHMMEIQKIKKMIDQTPITFYVMGTSLSGKTSFVNAILSSYSHLYYNETLTKRVDYLPTNILKNTGFLWEVNSSNGKTYEIYFQKKKKKFDNIDDPDYAEYIQIINQMQKKILKDRNEMSDKVKLSFPFIPNNLKIIDGPDFSSKFDKIFDDQIFFVVDMKCLIIDFEFQKKKIWDNFKKICRFHNNKPINIFFIFTKKDECFQNCKFPNDIKEIMEEIIYSMISLLKDLHCLQLRFTGSFFLNSLEIYSSNATLKKLIDRLNDFINKEQIYQLQYPLLESLKFLQNCGVYQKNRYENQNIKNLTSKINEIIKEKEIQSQSLNLLDLIRFEDFEFIEGLKKEEFEKIKKKIEKKSKNQI